MNKTVYISIGNSDDKLTQREWAGFVEEVRQGIRNLAYPMHGEWFSANESPYQNACWCVEVRPVMVDRLKERMGSIAKAYRQGSIAWAEANTEFLAPESGVGT